MEASPKSRCRALAGVAQLVGVLSHRLKGHGFDSTMFLMSMCLCLSLSNSSLPPFLLPLFFSLWKQWKKSPPGEDSKHKTKALAGSAPSEAFEGESVSTLVSMVCWPSVAPLPCRCIRPNLYLHFYMAFSLWARLCFQTPPFPENRILLGWGPLWWPHDNFIIDKILFPNKFTFMGTES